MLTIDLKHIGLESVTILMNTSAKKNKKSCILMRRNQLYLQCATQHATSLPTLIKVTVFDYDLKSSHFEYYLYTA